MDNPETIREARLLAAKGVDIRVIMNTFGVCRSGARRLLNPRKYVNAQSESGLSPKEIEALTGIPADRIKGFLNPASATFQQSLSDGTHKKRRAQISRRTPRAW